VARSPRLAVQTASGSITAEKVKAAEADFSTGYGHISLAHCAFETLSTKTNSGKVSQSDVQVQR
jgi:DUF4097 and DUF4098 domain-containing protein YvlB